MQPDLARVLASVLLVFPMSAAALGQGFDNRWVEFERADPGDLADVSSIEDELDFAWGDLDGDGWTDLVAVRVEPWTRPGKRTNRLFLNEAGTLRDRTAEFATGSDVPGDLGFLTPTADRDVEFVDVDLDGWLDVVTAVSVSDEDPKAIGHPRIYRNLGLDPSGSWLGLRYEEARIPALIQFDSGRVANPRFAGVAWGDVTEDGAPDLYFVDHDSSGSAGVGQPLGRDMNDRLLINGGSGFFVDESLARMTDEMLESTYGAMCRIADMNADGTQDILKVTIRTAPRVTSISYGTPGTSGVFEYFDDFHGFGGTGFEVGDLNNDGLLDLVSADLFQDRYRINRGNLPNGRVNWSPAFRFTYLKEEESKFAHNVVLADLDGDGWLDSIHCDEDADIPSGAPRYTHIYRNRTDEVEGVDLIEEREEDDAGWRGVVGMTESDLETIFDAAAFDIDRDGDLDLVFGRIPGGDVWINQTDPQVCGEDIGFGGPGSASLAVCGPPAALGATLGIELAGAAPDALGFLGVSQAVNPLPLLGGTVVVLPTSTLVPFTTGPGGDWSLPVELTTAAQATVTLQAVVADPLLPLGWAVTNAVQLTLGG